MIISMMRKAAVTEAAGDSGGGTSRPEWHRGFAPRMAVISALRVDAVTGRLLW